jgi:hypothetical protein
MQTQKDGQKTPARRDHTRHLLLAGRIADMRFSSWLWSGMLRCIDVVWKKRVKLSFGVGHGSFGRIDILDAPRFYRPGDFINRVYR